MRKPAQVLYPQAPLCALLFGPTVPATFHQAYQIYKRARVPDI
jgi:hypothetical protein